MTSYLAPSRIRSGRHHSSLPAIATHAFGLDRPVGISGHHGRVVPSVFDARTLPNLSAVPGRANLAGQHGLGHRHSGRRQRQPFMSRAASVVTSSPILSTLVQQGSLVPRTPRHGPSALSGYTVPMVVDVPVEMLSPAELLYHASYGYGGAGIAPKQMTRARTRRGSVMPLEAPIARPAQWPPRRIRPGQLVW